MHYVELKKMKEPQDIRKLDGLSKWTLFFNDVSESNKKRLIEELSKEMEEIHMATEILERVSADDRARAKYESRLKWILEKNTILNEAERVRKRAEEAEKKLQQEMLRAEQEMLRAEQESQRAENAIRGSVLVLKGIMNPKNIAETLNIDIKEVEKYL